MPLRNQEVVTSYGSNSPIDHLIMVSHSIQRDTIFRTKAPHMFSDKAAMGLGFVMHFFLL